MTEALRAYGEYTEDPVKAKQVYIPVNHLGGTLSPYLLQHAHDPIGWQSWSTEIFAIARELDRPVFLSAGYSSHHWCHVMARECFSDNEVAGMVNSVYIPVMMDREEYPSIASYFMEACIIQNGSAGYPLNIFLTPDGKPFFCTTWLPKRTTGQVPGLTDILPRIKWLWHMQREDVERSADELASKLKVRLSELSGHRGGHIGTYKVYEAMNNLRQMFDIRWGGFGTIPKLPEANKLIFLLEHAEGAMKSDALTMADITFRRMWRGGIHDHLGGGFCHYAADERWLVPHFEKLLCDNALLLYAVSKAQELTPNAFHRLFAEDIIFCATKYFADDAAYSQGFRSAIDGDTSEGEGRYYLWTEDELKQILPEGDAGLFCAAYAVLPSGNFGNELAGSQMGYNILYEASTVTELAKRYGLKGTEVGRRLYECRKVLLNARDNRYPLKADGKVIMSWNGLMIGALSRASTAFDQNEWREIAERTALFIRKSFASKSGGYNRIWINGHAVIEAELEDYACYLWGVMELYRACKHFNAGEKQLTDWLACAQEVADMMLARFWDEKHGGLYLTIEQDILPRQKSAEDVNFMPSSNALSATALTELGIILEEKKYTDYARKLTDCFTRNANEEPLRYLSLITASMKWKPARKKPVPPPEPVPTDEELNREEPLAEPSPPPEERRTSRTTRPARTERTERRRSGTHRRTRER